jgi:branched-chain amino acid transport system substrate-binding protein
VATIGPALTIAALNAGQVYGECGLVVIPPTAHGDNVPRAATTFQPVFNGGEMGSALAAYLKHVLGGHRAVVMFRKDGYGTPFAEGFDRAAMQLGLGVATYGFATDAERDIAVRILANDPEHPPLALGMLNEDAVPILVALRRQGYHSPVLGPSAIGGEDFVAQFAREPEEAQQKGFFTEMLYAASPILFDSANADTLAFAERFRQRYGHAPSWPAVQGYDSARLAIEAARQAPPEGSAGLTERRAAVRDYLVSLSNPTHAVEGVTGPIWFNPNRHRDQPVRVGLFHDGLFDSAPIQLVPVSNPNAQEVASGEVFEALPGQFVRRQRVVYTGVFVNEIPRLDLQRSTFNIDFYLWMRLIENAGPIGFDPTDIRFSGMSGSFARASPSETRTLPDGTVYHLWHVEGEVRNEFDLRRFPFDTQTLRLTLFNTKADASRVVYVLDRATLGSPGKQSLRMPPSSGALAAELPSAPAATIVAPEAFRQLTQWTPIAASELRENLVTDSTLGYPRSLGLQHTRELSGFVVDVDLQRRALATASKTLLPLIIMTIIMFASLYFPQGLVKEKVTVASAAALSGAVLLTSVNSQLGSIGYTIAAEYVFYVFFGLSLLCILSVLMAERLRTIGSNDKAAVVEQWTRVIFVITVIAVVGGAGILAHPLSS